jgi:hypothetical protein
VVIDEPSTSPYASAVAAPAFARIGREALRTMRIAPPAATRPEVTLPPLDGSNVRARPAASPTTTTTVPATTVPTTAPTATTGVPRGPATTTPVPTTSIPARGG